MRDRVPQRRKKPPAAGLYLMLQSVLLASIERGQFVVAVLGIVTIVMLLKMSSSDVGQLAFRLLEFTGHRAVLGYVLAIVLFIGWRIHVRYLQDQFQIEIDRMSAVSNEAQTKCPVNRVTSGGEPS